MLEIKKKQDSQSILEPLLTGFFFIFNSSAWGESQVYGVAISYEDFPKSLLHNNSKCITFHDAELLKVTFNGKK